MEAYEEALDRQKRSDSTSKVSQVKSANEFSKAEVSQHPPASPVARLGENPPRRWRRERQKKVPLYKRPLMIWLGVIGLLLGFAVAAVLIWLHARDEAPVTGPTTNSTTNGTSSALSGPFSATPTSSGTLSAAPLPAQSTAAPKMIYAIAYEPPYLASGCNFTYASVQGDLELMATLTTRIRTYSNVCNQSQIMFDLIKTHNIPLTVAQGVDMNSMVDNNPNDWIINQTYFQSEMQSALLIAKLYPDIVTSFLVGNECILKFLVRCSLTSHPV
jgi:hypothetical protein